jgi:putative phosphoribosyl transferase
MNLTTIDSQIGARNDSEFTMLNAELRIPARAAGLVIFCLDGESEISDPRNEIVARVFQENHLGTLLFPMTACPRDILGMSARLKQATAWAGLQERAHELPIGYFGNYNGAAAALVAAAELGGRINNIVCCAAALHRAEPFLEKVKSPTLLIVGGRDIPVVELNQRVGRSLRCEKSLAIIPRASHLFEEPGALPTVARIASGWFVKHFHGHKYFFVH